MGTPSRSNGGDLSELHSPYWERLLGMHGPAGLRVTRVQQYHDPKPDS